MLNFITCAYQKMKKNISEISLLAFLAAMILAQGNLATARSEKILGVKTITLKDMEIGVVTVHPDGTVINFPAKPEIHVGKKGAFELAFVENDLVVSGRTPGGKTNLFIYLGGRRYTLKLLYTGTSGDQIVSVRDPLDLEINAEAFHE